MKIEIKEMSMFLTGFRTQVQMARSYQGVQEGGSRREHKTHNEWDSR